MGSSIFPYSAWKAPWIHSAFENAAATTSPAGRLSPGKQQARKDLSSIMVAYHLHYVAQASVHNPVDLANKLNYRPKEELPITEWIFLQGRFCHLTDPKWRSAVDEFQRQVDQQWTWILKQAAAGSGAHPERR